MCLSFPLLLVAQKRTDSKYKEESDLFRKEVWGWAKPEFAVRNFPADYNSYSKVIIARHLEINGDSKRKSSLAAWGFAIYKQSILTAIAREAVKINDKSALEDYSEISFSQLERRSGYIFEDITNVYIGIRVYKPDGSLKEIDTDDAVLVKEDKKRKGGKIAVPDLQVGDIIDYFIASQRTMDPDGASIPPYELDIYADCPILSYSIHGEFGSKYAIEYREYNNAPKFKTTKNGDDNVIDIQEKNIPAYPDISLWVSPYRQLPIIRLNILLPHKGLSAKSYKSTKTGTGISKSGL